MKRTPLSSCLAVEMALDDKEKGGDSSTWYGGVWKLSHIHKIAHVEII